ncbi:MAG: CoB--CoM heterodisulfide reductase iron-sulfur subunit A family protein, partial [Bacteroidetes bacterium]|nr:CoB--CoM heterodisulfide reductase iron-sulfur subunit A family protein [Bacteroidota bacterium]
GKTPQRIGIVHCVGSRDEKAGNTYCSKVCCVTGVKQAIELKEQLPSSEIFNFYMDLRMYDRYFEDLYKEAQVKHHVQFIRGRLSEAFENPDGTVMIKIEDTLWGNL